MWLGLGRVGRIGDDCEDDGKKENEAGDGDDHFLYSVSGTPPRLLHLLLYLTLLHACVDVLPMETIKAVTEWLCQNLNSALSGDKACVPGPDTL